MWLHVRKCIRRYFGFCHGILPAQFHYENISSAPSLQMSILERWRHLLAWSLARILIICMVALERVMAVRRGFSCWRCFIELMIARVVRVSFSWGLLQRLSRDG